MKVILGFIAGVLCGAGMFSFFGWPHTTFLHDDKALPMSFDGVTVIVKNFDEQKKFYRDILGLKIETDYGDAVFFKLGDRKLGLFAHGHHEAGDESLEGAEKGISHFEFGIKREQYETLKKRLTDNGYHTTADNFRDADGNLFHFNYDGKVNW